MRHWWIIAALLCSACASRVTVRTPEQIANEPRYCGDAVYEAEEGHVIESLIQVALTEPEAYRCNPQTANRRTPQHYQDTGLPPVR